MKTKTILLTLVICAMVSASAVMFNFLTNINQPVTKQVVMVEKPQEKEITVTKPEKRQIPTSKLIHKKEIPFIQSSEFDIITEPEEEPGTVDSLKEKITDIAVEYTDDIYLLDELVEESASEPEELWEGEWVSIDDWKRNNDSFTVEKDNDGAFALIPDKDSTQSYSYNEETKEFEWVLDYYGKKITHKARFISEDVMVLMKISGIKVALDIYKRDAG